jgi:hypothetical protein
MSWENFKSLVKWLVGAAALIWLIGFLYQKAEMGGLFLPSHSAVVTTTPVATDSAGGTINVPSATPVATRTNVAAKVTWEAIPTGEGTDNSPVSWWAPDAPRNPQKGKFALQKRGEDVESFDSVEEFNESLAKYGWQIRPHQNPLKRAARGIYLWLTE